MSTANDNLPVLTDAVSEERCDLTVRVPTIVTAAFDPDEADSAGYDPYNSAPPVVDLRNRT